MIPWVECGKSLLRETLLALHSLLPPEGRTEQYMCSNHLGVVPAKTIVTFDKFSERFWLSL